MKKKIIIIIAGIVLGSFLGSLTVINVLSPKSPDNTLLAPLLQRKQVIGFLPYWLLDRASTDYSKYITTLTYFGLRIDENGNIQKLTTPQEEEPGWYALESGKLDPFFSNALSHNETLSLIISSGDVGAIDGLMNDPTTHAKNLVSDLTPILNKYKFSDINFDIEYVSQASPAARLHFTEFIKAVRDAIKNTKTITVEIAPTDVIRPNLIDPEAVGKLADNIVIMTYDYHSTASYVTGPVAPLEGAGTESEYDVTAAIENALNKIPPEKLILGIPLYGYEWESINQIPRSAIIPNSGVVASNKRAEDLLASCSTCSAKLDKTAEEEYISYFDQNTGTYHTIFYPDKKSTLAKLILSDKMQLGGVALWALGYEGQTILDPLEPYKKE